MATLVRKNNLNEPKYDICTHTKHIYVNVLAANGTIQYTNARETNITALTSRQTLICFHPATAEDFVPNRKTRITGAYVDLNVPRNIYVYISNTAAMAKPFNRT